MRKLTGTKWTPVKVAGWEPPKSYNEFGYVTFTDEGDVVGSDGCNPLAGDYAVTTDGSFHASVITTSDIGCANFPHAEVLNATANIEVKGSRLVLINRTGNVIGIYRT